MDVNDPVSVASRDLLGVAGRAVVDDDHLQRGVGLRQRAVDCLGQVPGLLVAGDDDGDQRLVAHFSALLGAWTDGRESGGMLSRPGKGVVVRPRLGTAAKAWHASAGGSGAFQCCGIMIGPWSSAVGSRASSWLPK